jgi:hypothetical protein
MLTKTKIALAAAVFAATSSAALAQGYDPNLANRYPGLAAPGAYGYVANANAPTRLNGAATFQSAPVQLRQGRDVGLISRDVALPGAEARSYGGQNWFNVERNDRASSPYAGGGF